MAREVIKVVPRSLTRGYVREEVDFSPNLVGNQYVDGTSFFTLGNFQITTNSGSRVPKDFKLGGEWSDYYNLDNLELTSEESSLFTTNEDGTISIKLNFNKKNISRYAYFGSFYELVRSTIETIIQKWKASIYINPTLATSYSTNTVFSYIYNSGNNTSYFTIPTNTISNNFSLIIEEDTSVNIPKNEIWDLNQSYGEYVLWISGDVDYKIIGFTGSTDANQYITVRTEGNPFPSLSGYTFGSFKFHIKPNKKQVNLFFEELNDFENVLLNRLTTPIYTSIFNEPINTDEGVFINERKLNWPISDGYNLDIGTDSYKKYIENILGIATNFDLNQTDLVSRRFVSESIHEFDTSPDDDGEFRGMKVTKLLRIYGREFDEVKKYIDGISFANVVTYNKLDNTSDELIKIIAKNLGFDVLLTTINDNFDILKQISTRSETVFSGYSRTLSAKELDTELWRRLVINAWWLFRSKGTRKVIEFFLNLFKIPSCSVTLNEYVYLAENKLDPNKVLVDIFNATGFFPNLDDLPLDSEGFPKKLPNTNSNYFQMGGFWYNGGNESSIGNNPHIGTYDYGKSYIDKYRCFNEINNESTTGITRSKNYFNNYNEGTFIFDTNGQPVPYYGDYYANQLNSYTQNATVTQAGLTVLGNNNGPTTTIPNGDDFSMKISFTTGNGEYCQECNYKLIYGEDGIVYYFEPNGNQPLKDSNCCTNYFNTENNTCYWCPKAKSISSGDDFLNLYEPTEIQSLAIDLGWSGSLNVTPETFISNLMSTFFTTYNTLLLDPNNNVISDKSCCELNGGNLVTISSKNYCVTGGVNNCSGGYVNNSHVWVI
jgi:hypothetical protein